jgi:hypothetical protein
MESFGGRSSSSLLYCMRTANPTVNTPGNLFFATLMRRAFHRVLLLWMIEYDISAPFHRHLVELHVTDVQGRK